MAVDITAVIVSQMIVRKQEVVLQGLAIAIE